MDANEALKRYGNGERNFRLQDLKGLNLVKADLSMLILLEQIRVVQI